MKVEHAHNPTSILATSVANRSAEPKSPHAIVLVA